jgi:hypothetical protein
MTATRHAYAITSTGASASVRAASPLDSTIASSSSGVTRLIRTRAEWKVKTSPVLAPRRANIAGSSVSIVVFELGTISPIRWTSTAPPRVRRSLDQ